MSETTNSAAYHSFVREERLSATIYQESITEGYVKMNGDKFILNPNPPPFVNHSGVMEKLKESVFQKCPDGNFKLVVLEPKLIFPLHEIFPYGVEDMKRDNEFKRKEEIKKKVLDKYHEKETKKEVLYRQKRLTKFVLKHKEVVNPYTEFLMCARKYVKGRNHGRRILKELEGIKNAKIRKYVQKFFKDLLCAIEEVPVVKRRMISTGQQTELDPFANAALVTDDQQLRGCICGKPNCLVRRNSFPL